MLQKAKTDATIIAIPWTIEHHNNIILEFLHTAIRPYTYSSTSTYSYTGPYTSYNYGGQVGTVIGRRRVGDIGRRGRIVDRTDTTGGFGDRTDTTGGFGIRGRIRGRIAGRIADRTDTTGRFGDRTDTTGGFGIRGRIRGRIAGRIADRTDTTRRLGRFGDRTDTTGGLRGRIGGRFGRIFDRTDTTGGRIGGHIGGIGRRGQIRGQRRIGGRVYYWNWHC